MQTFKNNSKYFIIAALTLSIVWGVFAQVTIPTGLTNAVQYIMETVWTDDGTDTGLVNVQIDDTNIYVRTGFLADGTGWNSKALGVDSSGNVVYVNANAINTPFFNLAGNYIPKINQAGNDLELSTMFQGTLGDISVGHINPLAKMHIQWDFRVDTISGSLMQYTYSTWGAQVIGAVTAPDPSQLCNCDTTTNALNCTAPSFTTGLVQWAGQFCVDITFSGWWTRNYRVYMQNTTNINQWAFIVTGNKVWVMTLTPQATLDVNGNVMIANIPQNLAPTQVLVPGPNGEVQYAPFPTGWWTYSLTNAQNIQWQSLLWWGVCIWGWTCRHLRWLLAWTGITITQTTPYWPYFNDLIISSIPQTLTLNGNTLSISSGNSVILPAGSSANAWNLTGNSWTNPSTNFIGTIDNNNLVFKTNNTIIWWLQTNGAVQRWIGNSVASNNATVAWGTNNQIQLNSNSSTIGWWQQNTISLAGGDSATIAGGKQNIISASYATIAGGWLNTGSGISSFIWGGYQNVAAGQNSVVVWGEDNTANWQYATIPGGLNNQALGNHSFAAGQNSTAAHPNSFVRSDGTVVSTTQIWQSLRYAWWWVWINTIPSYPTMNNQFLYPDITTSKNGIRIEPTPIAYMPPNPPFPWGCITAWNYSCEANTEWRIVYISDTCNNDYYVQVCTIDPLTSNHDRRRLDRQ